MVSSSKQLPDLMGTQSENSLSTKERRQEAPQIKNIKIRLLRLPKTFHSSKNGVTIRAAISNAPFIKLLVKISPLREPAFSPEGVKLTCLSRTG